MHPNEPFDIRDRLEKLGGRPEQPKTKSMSVLKLYAGSATFALGVIAALVGQTAISAIPPAINQDGVDWLVLEIAEKHQLSPTTARKIVEQQIYTTD